MSRPTVQLKSNSPISSVALVDQPKPAVKTTVSAAGREAEIQKLQLTIKALEQAAEDLQEYGRQLFASHREQLIRLSIEIAAKVLAKDIHERNYEIEKIITQALEEIPKGQPVTVKLNPDDLKTCQQALDQKDEGAPEHLHLAPDWTIGPGECVVETEQGVIEWIIEDHLNRISNALLGSSRNA